MLSQNSYACHFTFTFLDDLHKKTFLDDRVRHLSVIRLLEGTKFAKFCWLHARAHGSRLGPRPRPGSGDRVHQGRQATHASLLPAWPRRAGAALNSGRPRAMETKATDGGCRQGAAGRSAHKALPGRRRSAPLRPLQPLLIPPAFSSTHAF